MLVADPLGALQADAPALPAALHALKAQMHADLAEFRREVGWRLPSVLEPASAAEIRQHLGPFLEQTFRAWAERENQEVQQALGEIAARATGGSSGSEPNAPPSSRLLHPTFEVSTVAVDAGVVAALALGIATVFANAALGGVLLLAAPALATFGREREARAVRQRAAESAMKSIEEAVLKLSFELDRVIEEFARRVPADLSAAR